MFLELAFSGKEQRVPCETNFQTRRLKARFAGDSPPHISSGVCKKMSEGNPAALAAALMSRKNAADGLVSRNHSPPKARMRGQNRPDRRARALSKRRTSMLVRRQNNSLLREERGHCAERSAWFHKDRPDLTRRTRMRTGRRSRIMRIRVQAKAVRARERTRKPRQQSCRSAPPPKADNTRDMERRTTYRRRCGIISLYLFHHPHPHPRGLSTPREGTYPPLCERRRFTSAAFPFFLTRSTNSECGRISESFSYGCS
jgi:hypothetical protein